MSSVKHKKTIKGSKLYRCGDNFRATDAATIIKRSTSMAITILAEMVREGSVSINVTSVGEHNEYRASIGMRRVLRMKIRQNTDQELGLNHNEGMRI
jgi:1,4-alpha-glucan branching enzyme